jgi:hypothetical protein
MIKLLSIETAQLSTASITVTWKFQSSTESFSDYRLSVLQAQAPESDLSLYDVLTSGIDPSTTAYYEDTSVSGITDKYVDYFYRIIVSGMSGQGIYVSDPYGINVEEDKYAREIERRRALVLNLHSGQTFYVFKRRAYGTVCPVCYEPTLQRTTRSDCTTCYGTGYLNGYYSPIPARGQFNERPTREIHQLFSSWQDQDAVLYMKSNPPLNPKDVVVDRLFRRWLVQNVGATQKSVHTIAQIAQLRQVEHADVIYQLPVDFTAKP